jgi:hypothetical protein
MFKGSTEGVHRSIMLRLGTQTSDQVIWFMLLCRSYLQLLREQVWLPDSDNCRVSAGLCVSCAECLCSERPHTLLYHRTGNRYVQWLSYFTLCTLLENTHTLLYSLYPALISCVYIVGVSEQYD